MGGCVGVLPNHPLVQLPTPLHTQQLEARAAAAEARSFGLEAEAAAAEQGLARRRAAADASLRAAADEGTAVQHGAAAAEAENYRVLLTTRQKLSEGSIALPRPLRVTVPVD